jgi:fructose-bisphosphate aldolase class II
MAGKFTRKPTGEVLAMDRIEEIHRRLPNCHLVMHGSSSVPQELQDIINKYGGKLKQTWGAPTEPTASRTCRQVERRLRSPAPSARSSPSRPKSPTSRYLKPARDAMKGLRGPHDCSLARPARHAN